MNANYPICFICESKWCPHTTSELAQMLPPSDCGAKDRHAHATCLKEFLGDHKAKYHANRDLPACAWAACSTRDPHVITKCCKLVLATKNKPARISDPLKNKANHQLKMAAMSSDAKQALEAKKEKAKAKRRQSIQAKKERQREEQLARKRLQQDMMRHYQDIKDKIKKGVLLHNTRSHRFYLVTKIEPTTSINDPDRKYDTDSDDQDQDQDQGQGQAIHLASQQVELVHLNNHETKDEAYVPPPYSGLYARFTYHANINETDFSEMYRNPLYVRLSPFKLFEFELYTPNTQVEAFYGPPT